MPNRVGVDPRTPAVGEQSCAHPCHLRAGGIQIKDTNVEVHLLRVLRIGPAWPPLVLPTIPIKREIQPTTRFVTLPDQQPALVDDGQAQQLTVEFGQLVTALLAVDDRWNPIVTITSGCAMTPASQLPPISQGSTLSPTPTHQDSRPSAGSDAVEFIHKGSLIGQRQVVRSRQRFRTSAAISSTDRFSVAMLNPLMSVAASRRANSADLLTNLTRPDP